MVQFLCLTVYISKMTPKPSKLGQTDLVFSSWSEFTSRSVHAGSQLFTCSGYDLYHPGPKFTDDLTTTLRQFSDVRQS